VLYSVRKPLFLQVLAGGVAQVTPAHGLEAPELDEDALELEDVLELLEDVLELELDELELDAPELELELDELELDAPELELDALELDAPELELDAPELDAPELELDAPELDAPELEPPVLWLDVPAPPRPMASVPWAQPTIARSTEAVASPRTYTPGSAMGSLPFVTGLRRAAGCAEHTCEEPAVQEGRRARRSILCQAHAWHTRGTLLCSGHFSDPRPGTRARAASRTRTWQRWRSARDCSSVKLRRRWRTSRGMQ
jgi:hypothetical protein